MRRCLVATLAVLLWAHSSAEAAPKARVVDSAQLLSTAVQYRSGTRSKSKVIYCLSKTPGNVKSTDGGVLFTPIAATVAKMKAKRIGGAKLAGVLALNKAGKSACIRLQNGGAVPTPTPAAGGSGNFDSSGNLTPLGKIAFGVPSTVNGNISTGRSLTLSYCSCHVERTGRSFPALRSALAQSPMSFDNTQITDPMLASITAYLNRFRF